MDACSRGERHRKTDNLPAESHRRHLGSSGAHASAATNTATRGPTRTAKEHGASQASKAASLSAVSIAVDIGEDTQGNVCGGKSFGIHFRPTSCSHADARPKSQHKLSGAAESPANKGHSNNESGRNRGPERHRKKRTLWSRIFAHTGLLCIMYREHNRSDRKETAGLECEGTIETLRSLTRLQSHLPTLTATVAVLGCPRLLLCGAICKRFHQDSREEAFSQRSEQDVPDPADHVIENARATVTPGGVAANRCARGIAATIVGSSHFEHNTQRE